MTEKSRKKLNDLFDSLVIGKRLDFTDEEVDLILSNPSLTEKLIKTLEFLSFHDSRFGPSYCEFEFTVPENYDNDHQIDNFVANEKKSGCPIAEELNDENFKKVSHKLIPGKTYIGKFYPIFDIVSGKDCISFLKKRNAFLLGAQGLTFLSSLVDSSNLPQEKWIYSFDLEESLFFDGENYFAPAFFFNKMNYILNNIEFNLDKGDCLFCVFEK